MNVTTAPAPNYVTRLFGESKLKWMNERASVAAVAVAERIVALGNATRRAQAKGGERSERASERLRRR